MIVAVNDELSRTLIVGVGSALVDLLAREDDAFLKQIDAAKGGMILVDEPFIQSVVSRLTGQPTMVPGGSACNTLVGVGRLGGEASFVGKRGEDALGDLLEEGLLSSGVRPKLFRSEQPTGRVLSIITPDAQRSMLTFLGASLELSISEITPDCFAEAAVVHVEGYLLFNRDLITTVVTTAKQAGARVSLDLASYTVVKQAKPFLESLVYDCVDILMANEDEARVFTGESDEDSLLKLLSEKVETAVLKLGERGSVISHRGEIVKVAPTGSSDIIDTTGAGDLWASGFLYGLVNDLPLEQCGKIASACGYEVCRVVGAVIPDDGWERIKSLL
jgi:sugar/nucleoside kinase (ribokinase family)